MDLPIKSFLEATKKFGPWAALALVLVGVMVFRFDEKVDALAAQLGHHISDQDRQVRLLEIMCIAVVDTAAERKACEMAAGK